MMEQRAVVITLAIDIVVNVPADWGASLIDFRYQDSSYCIDNVLHDLEDYMKAHPDGCMCHCAIGTFIRDAKVEDLESLPVMK